MDPSVTGGGEEASPAAAATPDAKTVARRLNNNLRMIFLLLGYRNNFWMARTRAPCPGVGQPRRILQISHGNRLRRIVAIWTNVLSMNWPPGAPRPCYRLVFSIHAFSGCSHARNGWKNAPWLFPVEMATSSKEAR